MLNYIKNTLVLISLSILVSCGSYTKSTIKYINPSKEIDKATLCIYRVDSFVGSFFPTTVYLDGNKLCVLHMKGYIVTNVVPGPHEIIVPDAAILDPKYPMYKIVANFKTDEIVYIKFDPSIHLVGEDVATNDLQNLFYDVQQ